MRRLAPYQMMLIGGIALALVLILFASSGNPAGHPLIQAWAPPPTVVTQTVKYFVQGPKLGQAIVSYQDRNVLSQTTTYSETVPLPWTHTVTLPVGELLSVTAKKQGGAGEIECDIYVDLASNPLISDRDDDAVRCSLPAR